MPGAVRHQGYPHMNRKASEEKMQAQGLSGINSGNNLLYGGGRKASIE